ncbi:MAG: hypothetical protein HQK77_22320, partial [Desulfobacterales bacterium]|nr:hypothetical protein [Desulfobacterales bacterium]
TLIDSSKTWEKALVLCHYNHEYAYPVQAAFREDRWLIFLTRITSTEFSLPVLEQVLELLTNLHNTLL